MKEVRGHAATEADKDKIINRRIYLYEQVMKEVKS